MSGHSIFYGDIHNHNAHGYGVGSIERSLDIARTHLDFFAFTGHSSWHDMPSMEGQRERHWIDGFKRLKDTWPRVQQVIAEGNRDGEFCAFLGFEWHSSQWGDQCVVFPEDHRPLFYASDPEKLHRFCVEERALMIPHHLAYPKGHRGVNWEVFREDCTPVVEIFSEHGNSEDDRGPFAFYTHSMGGRETANTARAALDAGKRFGFVASSDDHAGFPGAYGEGLMAVHAQDLSRGAILEAVRARRTYALTGDRIEVDFAVEGAPMGATVTAGKQLVIATGSAPRSIPGIDVDGTTFDNVRLTSTGGTIANFDNVTFQNMSQTATQLTISHPGAATPFAFDNVDFLTTPTSGRYLQATDSAADGNTLTLTFTNATPAAGAPYIATAGGAVVNWP